MPQHRQLAAILFTDIEGYTATMQQSEEKAVSQRNRHREVLEQGHKQFNGRIIQFYGDGTLSIFQSAVEAVQCALHMQQVFCQHPHIPVRMGLHTGDIILNDGQVLGDGVNLASRIESLGVAGCVLISDKVKDEIMNHPDLKTISVGVYQLKNINRPVEVFALDHPWLIKPKQGSLTGKTIPQKNTTPATGKKVPAKSVGVLPFVNISNDPEQDYFSTGIAEDILNSLSNLKDLKVAGRISSQQYNRENIQELGEKLGVKTILEGSVRKQGNRVRIMVQLVNVQDGFHIWSQKYDRDMDDIFAIQDEVALAVTEKLKVTLLEKDRARITKIHTKNTGAYELYLKGRFYLAKRGASIITAMHFFQLAIDLDPGFSLAYTGLADAGISAAIYGLVPPKQLIGKVRQAAETSLKLDPNLSEPYCSLGAYYTIFEWNWPEAKKNFNKSIEINPGNTQAHYWYGLNYLSWIKNDQKEAEKHGQLATELEPLSAICFGMYGAILHSSGKLQEALGACTTGTELDSSSYLSHLYKGWTYLTLKEYDKAAGCFYPLMVSSNRHHISASALTMAYYLMGNITGANELLVDLKTRSASEYVGYAAVALAISYVEGVDEALVYFERAFEERDPVILTMKYSDMVPAALRADPRFQLLLERIGFP
jgi:adenylate cyclase